MLKSGDSQRHRGTAAEPAGSREDDAARVLRVDRRQSDHVPAEIPGLRRRRHGAGLPGSVAASRARSHTPAAHSRGLTGENYSPRSPATGPLPAARRAGHQHAAAPTLSNTSGTTIKITASLEPPRMRCSSTMTPISQPTNAPKA